jgi:hypothetical protein
MNLLEAVIDLAKEVGSTDPIDFGYIPVDEDSVYQTVASGLVEKILANDPEDRLTILLATVTHLVVENTILNLKLMNHN